MGEASARGSQACDTSIDERSVKRDRGETAAHLDNETPRRLVSCRPRPADATCAVRSDGVARDVPYPHRVARGPDLNASCLRDRLILAAPLRGGDGADGSGGGAFQQFGFGELPVVDDAGSGGSFLEHLVGPLRNLVFGRIDALRRALIVRHHRSPA